jgi:hypothetical protein
MHYRNGREAKNGDQIVQLDGGKVTAVGTLDGATAGNDYCNGSIVPTQQPGAVACLCDCLHVDDLAALIELELEQMDRLTGRTFNVGGGAVNSVSLVEMTELCRELSGRSVAVASAPPYGCSVKYP